MNLLDCGICCIDKDVTRHRNSAAIQNYNAYGIFYDIAHHNRMKDRRQKIPWPTKNYQDNRSDKQHWRQVLPAKESS